MILVLIWNVDATKSDQGVRGSSTLPHGIGKNMKVVAFADAQKMKKLLKMQEQIL
jgi:ribosomal protein L1